MAERSDPELDRRRRDLYAISIGLLVFNLAGGYFEPTATTVVLFGSIHITRPLVLLFGAWVMWGYFLWQFWKMAKPARKTFLQEFDQEFYKSQDYIGLCKKIFIRIVEIGRESGLPYSPSETVRIIEHTRNLANDGFCLAVKEGTFGMEFHRNRAIISGDSIRDVNTLPDELWSRVLTDVQWPKRPRLRMAADAWWRAVWHREAFSERLLPWVVAWSAVIIQFARLGWWSCITPPHP